MFVDHMDVWLDILRDTNEHRQGTNTHTHTQCASANYSGVEGGERASTVYWQRECAPTVWGTRVCLHSLLQGWLRSTVWGRGVCFHSLLQGWQRGVCLHSVRERSLLQCWWRGVCLHSVLQDRGECTHTCTHYLWCCKEQSVLGWPVWHRWSLLSRQYHTVSQRRLLWLWKYQQQCRTAFSTGSSLGSDGVEGWLGEVLHDHAARFLLL